MDRQMTKEAVARLRTLTAVELAEEYARTFGGGGTFPGGTFARRRLAHRLQERELGGLTKAEAGFLDGLARRDPKTCMRSAPAPAPGRPKAEPVRGATYVREYKGKVYEARVSGYGQYELEGRLYPSLTACVKAITGQHCSGRRWFRLKGAL